MAAPKKSSDSRSRWGRSVPLATLVEAAGAEATTRDFAGPEAPRFYATARLLCVYLHERDALVALYAKLRERPRGDPTGGAALEAAAGKSLAALEAAFKAWLDEQRRALEAAGRSR
jgi:hypothetical protein